MGVLYIAYQFLYSLYSLKLLGKAKSLLLKLSDTRASSKVGS